MIEKLSIDQSRQYQYGSGTKFKLHAMNNTS